MRKIIFLLLVVVVIVIGLLHYFTPGHLFFYHDTYRRLSYFPIAIGAILFGVRGGLSLAVMTSVAFIPHLILFITYEPDSYLSEVTEIILYLAAGIVIGVIASRESKLREKYKQLSEKLSRSFDRLHQQTGLLIDVEGQLAASQKMSALGQLSASLAHEIKNPLSSIKGTAEILLDEFPEGHAKREFVEILLSETARLDASVARVLQFSRENKVDEDIVLQSVSQVITRVAALLEIQLKRKSIDLEIDHLSKADTVQVDGHRLSQVFLNILLNAIDAVSDGGKIRVEAAEEPGGICVSISDNGPGIQPDDQDRIFEPFFTLKEGGTGLGLSITQKIIASIEGRIFVSAGEDGGACFNIFIPRRNQHGSPYTSH